MMRKTLTVAGAAALMTGLAAADPAAAETITIATVNNADMIIMQRLAPQWEQETGNDIEWVVLEENVLRQRATTDIATGGGQFDVITIGSYETPIWGAQGWLEALDDFDDAYDYEDIFEPVRNGLSSEGTLYAVPFYAESSFTFYRKDLFEQAGLQMPEQPTYQQIAQFAEALHKPQDKQYGVCLRGKPGWGENMAFIGPMVNSFGGRWFDMEWQPQLTSSEWKAGVAYYVDLMNNYGPPGAASNGHNENRALFASGNCAMWVDATSAAGFIYNPSESRVADTTAFAKAPIANTPQGAAWSWAWALAVPTSSDSVDVAKEFVQWATSKEYVALAGNDAGWVSAPPGTRASTYAREEYLEAAPFAKFVEQAILSADPTKATAEPVPYTGIQFVAIPEFQGIGTQTGQQIAAALTGQATVDEALQTAQDSALRTMQQSGYIQE